MVANSAAAMEMLVDIAEMMNGINANIDSANFLHELEANIGFIVDRMLPRSDFVKKEGYKRRINGGMTTAVSKAYQYHMEAGLPRDNTTIVVDPKAAKRARRP